MFRNILQSGINFIGVACRVLWYKHRTAYAIDEWISLHGVTASNVTLARSLVLRIIPTTWWIIFKIVFSCGFVIVVHVSLTVKYLSNGTKFILNLEPFSKISLRGLVYLEIHHSLNILDIIAEDLSMIGASAISNHPVSGLIKVVHNIWSSFVIIFCRDLWLCLI